MNVLERIFAYLVSLFDGDPSNDSGGGVSASVAELSDLSLDPGTLTPEAAANYSDLLTWENWGLYSPDVSGGPGYPSSAGAPSSNGSANTDWQQRVLAFLTSLGIAPVPGTPSTPTTPTNTVDKGGPTGTGTVDVANPNRPGSADWPAPGGKGGPTGTGTVDVANPRPRDVPQTPVNTDTYNPVETPNQSLLNWGLIDRYEDDPVGNRRRSWLGGDETPTGAGNDTIGASHPSPDLGFTPPPPTP